MSQAEKGGKLGRASGGLKQVSRSGNKFCIKGIKGSTIASQKPQMSTLAGLRCVFKVTGGWMGRRNVKEAAEIVHAASEMQTEFYACFAARMRFTIADVELGTSI